MYSNFSPAFRDNCVFEICFFSKLPADDKGLTIFEVCGVFIKRIDKIEIDKKRALNQYKRSIFDLLLDVADGAIDGNIHAIDTMNDQLAVDAFKIEDIL